MQDDRKISQAEGTQIVDLWQLKVFTSVVVHKSFSRAGEAIYLSQPTVSSHIKELEEHFGCRLIDRLGRQALPTKAGELLFSYAQRLLNLKDETESAVSDFLGSIRGSLTIGGSTIPAGYIIPKLIGPFATEHPEVSLCLKTGDTAEVVELISRGEAEVGIVGAKVKNPQIHQEKILQDEMKLIVPPSHPWAVKEIVACDKLFQESFLSREEGSGTWKSIAQSMIQAGYDPANLNILAIMGSTFSVIQSIKNLAGISILSTIAVEEDLSQGHLAALSVDGLDLQRCFYLTTHKKRTPSPLSKAFIRFLKEHL